MLASLALDGPEELGLSLRPCGKDVCVAWVMPAGQAWQSGARPGMRVVSLNGRDVHGAVIPDPLREAELLSPEGRRFAARDPAADITRRWADVTLWLTGACFAFLGALVLVRRPDALVARLFAVFTGLTSMALGVAPAAASGTQPAWSLVVVFLSLLGVAASLPAFATAFVGDWSRNRKRFRFFWLAGGAVLVGYLASLFRPTLYGQARTGFAIYFVTSILATLVVLARKALVRNALPSTRDARLALSGIACGMLPFVVLSLVPLVVVNNLVPADLTAILWGIIPLTFAYAILRHQTLGIRRLVHRGMVYGITTVATLAVMLFLVVAADSLVERSLGARRPAWLIAALLTSGAFLFHFLHRGVRELVDQFFYPEEVDSGTLLAAMRSDLVENEHAEEVVAAMVNKLRESLRLEAAVLFLGTTAETMRVAAASGPRADESIAFVRPRLLEMRFGEYGLRETRWRSDVLLVARLEAGGHALGYLVLGPKERGEIFVREERHLVETFTPILALAIRETSLVAELREVSERLTNAQEAERGRIARDLHDGPLQKAILLGGGVDDATLRDRNGVARELAAELRELCARLRPAILDDLGLVPALEWLLERTAQGFTVTPHLTLSGMSEDDRLAPNAELALFRVTQEAVSNALKHGHPTSIHVSLTKTMNGIELSVIDDGDGTVFAGDMRRGLGIPGMRERLRQVGGSVSIASDGRTGTMVSARIPYVVQGEQ